MDDQDAAPRLKLLQDTEDKKRALLERIFQSLFYIVGIGSAIMYFLHPPKAVAIWMTRALIIMTVCVAPFVCMLFYFTLRRDPDIPRSIGMRLLVLGLIIFFPALLGMVAYQAFSIPFPRLVVFAIPLVAGGGCGLGVLGGIVGVIEMVVKRGRNETPPA